MIQKKSQEADVTIFYPEDNGSRFLFGPLYHKLYYL